MSEETKTTAASEGTKTGEAEQPKFLTKIKLTKGFEHNGRQYNAGDEFEGSPEDIANLIREGYADDPAKEKDKGKGAGQQQQQHDPGPGAGYNTSTSSSSPASDYGHGKAVADKPTYEQSQSHTSEKKK